MCVLLDADGCVRKRSLVRRSIHNRKMQGLSNTATATANSNAYGYPYADTNPNGDANSYGNSNAYAMSVR